MGYVFAITGDSASGKSTLAELLKNALSNTLVLECDRYHRWERGDPHWHVLTHLNPEANRLDKMQQDILDLKSGNPIHEVEYDHSSGKFTDPRIESPADNIIVCGLHSFFTEGEVYDLKIYMDPDPQMRIKWKVARDTSERKHSEEAVLKQIAARKADFERYVLPQRSLADIIVNFNKQGLALLIRRKYDLSKLGLDAYAVNSVDPDFHILRFAPDNRETHYQHIISVILSLKGISE